MGRPLLLIAAVVGIALALWWAATSPDAPPRPPEEQGPLAEERITDPPDVPPPDPAPPAPEPVPREDEAPGDGFLVEGRVVYVGSETPPGEVRVVLERLSEGGERVEATGAGGRFRAEFPAPGRYRVEELVADGVRHELTWNEFTVREGGELVLRIARTKAVVLVVTDALTGAPLAGARASDGIGARDTAEIDHFGSWRGRIVHAIPRWESGVRKADAQGRIPLTPERWGDVAVIADGYAWAIVNVPRSAGGEIRVGLLPGGAVRVLIPRWGDLERPALLIKIEGHARELRLEHEVRDGEVRLDGVLAGSHELLVKEGGRNAEVAGKAVVTVLPGQEVRTTIDVEPARVPSVEVTGRVTIPKTWRRTPSFIVFQKRRKDQGRGESRTTRLVSEEGAETGVHQYRFEGITPGTYFVEVEPFQFYREVEVRSDSVMIDFALPEPVEVRIRVVGTDTGEDLPGADVLWHSVMKGLGGYGLSGAARAADGRFTFQAPPGRIEVSAKAEGYRNAREEVEVSGTRIEHQVRLKPGAILLVRFRLDGEDFSGDDIWCDLLGRGRRGRRGDPEGVRYPDLAPGEYTLKVRPIAGFEPVPERKIEVRSGLNEVVVELIRKR